jgi:4-hydroxythreonine-4-phosphate dehydrogenase
MTREQAQAPFLSMYDGNGIALAAGIAPLVISPVKIDGDNKATVDSFREAIYTCIDVYRSRYFFDLPYANPLPKMYHERREDGEKVRFAVKKRPEDGEQKESAPKGEASESKTDSEKKEENKEVSNS